MVFYENDIKGYGRGHLNGFKSSVVKFNRFLLITLFSWLTLHVAWANNHTNGSYVDAVDSLYDSSGQLQIEDLSTIDWRPLNGVLSGGFKSGAHWVRIKIKAHDEPLILRIRPAFVDQVKVFLVQGKRHGEEPRLETTNNVPLGILGDQSLPSQEYASTSLNGRLVIPPSDQTRTLFLQLTSVSSHLLLAEVQTLEEASAFEQNQHLLLGVYLGFLLTFAIWAIAQLYLGYDKVIAAFLIKQIADLAYVSGFTGLTGMVLTRAGLGSWADLAFSLSVLTVVAAGTWFHASLLSEFRPYKWAIRLLWSGIFMLPVGILLFVVGEMQLALLMNTVVANLFPILTLICALTAGAYREKSRTVSPPGISKFQLIVTYAVFALSLQVATLPALGLWAGQELTLNAFLVHGLLTSLLLLALLMTRAKQYERNRLEARAQMNLMEQEVRLLSEKRQEQSQFMAMLVHELKTPLSVIRMVLGGLGVEPALRQAASRAVGSMSDVIERCRQAEMVGDLEIQAAKFEAINLKDLSLDLIEERELSRRVRLEMTNPVSVTLDRTLVKVILSNLLDNANKYSPTGSLITLRLEANTHRDLQGALLEVSNLPNAGATPDPERVFDKYYRHASAQRDTGSGLGLFLVRELASRLGGWVRYDPPSQHKPTLSFRVWLPLQYKEVKGYTKAPA